MAQFPTLALLHGNDEFSIAELAEKVIDMTGFRARIKKLPLPEDDPQVRRPDIGLASKTLDWKPKVSLEEGLRLTIDYFETQFIAES